MSMRSANKRITICEILRKINDIHQGESVVDKKTRKLLSEAETMAKKMSRKLLEYNKKEYQGWWKKNKNYEKEVELRLSRKYITGERDEPKESKAL